MPFLVNYCLDCEWVASTENRTRIEQAALVIEHAVEMDHDIDSEYRDEEGSATGWTDEWPPTE